MVPVIPVYNSQRIGIIGDVDQSLSCHAVEFCQVLCVFLESDEFREDIRARAILD
jgi:hypothetical protein